MLVPFSVIDLVPLTNSFAKTVTAVPFALPALIQPAVRVTDGVTVIE